MRNRKKFRHIRRAAGIYGRDIAARVGLHVISLRLWESGKRELSGKTVEKLNHALDLAVRARAKKISSLVA